MTLPPPSPHHALADKQTHRKWARGPRLREAHSDNRGLLLKAARPESELLVRCSNLRLQVPPLLALLLMMMKRKKKKKKREREEEKPRHKKKRMMRKTHVLKLVKRS